MEDKLFIHQASWITKRGIDSRTVPVFRRDFDCPGRVTEALLEVTCAGVYEAELNGARVGDFILAPAGRNTTSGCRCSATT